MRAFIHREIMRLVGDEPNKNTKDDGREAQLNDPEGNQDPFEPWRGSIDVVCCHCRPRSDDGLQTIMYQSTMERLKEQKMFVF